MPTIGKEVFKEVKLVTEGAVVTLLTNPKSDLWEEMANQRTEKNGSALMLSKLITKWNFTEEDGTPSEITAENVQRALSAFDITAIMDALGLEEFILSDAKKNRSLATSTPEATPQPSTLPSNTEKSSE